MIKTNKEQNPSPSFDTVVPETKWKPDLIPQQAWSLILTGPEHSPLQEKLSRVLCHCCIMQPFYLH